MINREQFENLVQSCSDVDYIDTLSKSGVHLLSIVETPDGSPSLKLSTNGGYLHFAVLNDSHRYKISVEFTAKPEVGIALLDGNAKEKMCRVIAFRKLNRKTVARPYEGHLTLSIILGALKSGQQDETITSSPHVSRLNTNNCEINSSQWEDLRNTFSIGPANRGQPRMAVA